MSDLWAIPPSVDTNALEADLRHGRGAVPIRMTGQRWLVPVLILDGSSRLVSLMRIETEREGGAVLYRVRGFSDLNGVRSDTGETTSGIRPYEDLGAFSDPLRQIPKALDAYPPLWLEPEVRIELEWKAFFADIEDDPEWDDLDVEELRDQCDLLQSTNRTLRDRIRTLEARLQVAQNRLGEHGLAPVE